MASWVPAWPLLEQQPSSLADEIGRKAAASGFDLPPFPYDELLASAMRSGMDYWAELAVDWAEEVPLGRQAVEAANELTSQSWASQKVRQRARKIVRTHEKS
jgi:hypothetical protein